MTLLESFTEVGLQKLIPADISLNAESKSAYWDGFKNGLNIGAKRDFFADPLESEFLYEDVPEPYDDDNDYMANTFAHDDADYYDRLEKRLDYIFDNDDEDDEEKDEQELLRHIGTVESDCDYRSLDELKIAFDNDRGFELLENEEFINMSLPRFFGITGAQMKFINFELLQSGDVEHFVFMVNNDSVKSFIPSIEQRIRFSAVCAATGIDQIYDIKHGNPLSLSHDELDTVRDYIKRIIIHHTDTDAVNLLELLRDYYRFLPNASVINEIRQPEERQPYVLTPKPAHIRDLHNKASRDSAQYLRELEVQSREDTDLHIKWITESPEYQQFLYKDDNYAIIAPKDATNIEREGLFLENCIANYIPDFAKGKTYLYFLRKISNLSEPYFAIELLRKSDFSTKFKLTQCYTVGNSKEKEPQCAEFIKKWARLKHIEVVCEI